MIPVQSIRRWHWILISLLIGAGLWYVSSLNDIPGNRYSTFRDEADFEGGILSTYPSTDGKPMPRTINVVVTPYKMDSEVREDTKTAKGTESKLVHRLVPGYIVKCDYYPRGSPRRDFAPHYSFFSNPYVSPSDPAFTKAANKTVVEFLKVHNISFRYEWWKEPRNSMLFWFGGSFVIVGLVWPTVLNLVAYGNVFAPPRPKEAKPTRRVHTSTPAPSQKRAQGLTQADLDQLKAMEAQLEEKLKAGAGPRVAQAQAEKPAEVRKLTGDAPVQPAAGSEAHDDRQFERKQGGYYPVERRTKKE